MNQKMTTSLMAAIVIIASASSAVAIDSVADYTYQRIVADFDALEARLDALRKDAAERIVGSPKNSNGDLIEKQEVLDDIDTAKKALARGRANLAEFYMNLSAGESTASDVVNRCASEALNAIEVVWDAELHRVHQAVRAIRGRQHFDSSQLAAQHESDLNKLRFDLELRDAGIAEQNRETEALRAQYLPKEEVIFADARRAYEQLTLEVVEARSELAGMAWKLEDFFDRLDQPQLRDTCRRFVFEEFALRLKQRDPAMLRRVFGGRRTNLDSTLDFFVIYPGNKTDRMSLFGFIAIPEPKRLEMHNAFVNAPVESLRKLDRGMEPLSFDGTILEQHVRMLEARFDSYRTASQRRDAAMVELDRVNQEMTNGISIEGFARLALDLHAFDDRVEEIRRANVAHAAAADALTEAESTLARRERELAEALYGVFVDEQTGKRVEQGSPRAKPVSDAITSFHNKFEHWSRLANDAANPENERKAAQAIATQMQVRIDACEQLIAEQHSEPKQREAEARDAVNQARAQLKASPRRSDSSLGDLWTLMVKRWRELTPPVFRSFKTPSKPLPRLWNGMKPGDLDGHADLLDEATRKYDQRQQHMRQYLTDRYFEAVRYDARLVPLAASISGLKASGAIEVNNAIESLGLTPDDPLMAEFKKMRTSLQEASDFFKEFDKQAGRVEWVSKYGFPKSDAAKIPEQMRSNLRIVKTTLGKLNTGANVISEIDSIMKNAESPRTSLDALSSLLDLAKTVVGAVPVAGKAISPFLDLYARSATASAKAARLIQGKVIARNLQLQFGNEPDHRLITRDEVAQAIGLQNEDAINRATTMVQVRRLLTLLSEAP